MECNASTASAGSGVRHTNASWTTTGATIAIDNTGPPTMHNLHTLPSSGRLRTYRTHDV